MSTDITFEREEVVRLAAIDVAAQISPNIVIGGAALDADDTTFNVYGAFNIAHFALELTADDTKSDESLRSSLAKKLREETVEAVEAN